MENRSRSHRRCPARSLGGKCLSNATYWMLVIHHGGELQLNAFLMPACLTGSLSLLQYTVDARLHLNAMKCKGSAPWTLLTPCYKKSILGSKWTISGINFFCRFLLRLSENNHSRVMFMAKFGPTASNFCYEILMIFWVEIRAFVRPHV